MLFKCRRLLKNLKATDNVSQKKIEILVVLCSSYACIIKWFSTYIFFRCFVWKVVHRCTTKLKFLSWRDFSLTESDRKEVRKLRFLDKFELKKFLFLLDNKQFFSFSVLFFDNLLLLECLVVSLFKVDYALILSL